MAIHDAQQPITLGVHLGLAPNEALLDAPPYHDAMQKHGEFRESVFSHDDHVVAMAGEAESYRN